MSIAINKQSERLYSLDALRGFDMFWIMGAEQIFHNLFKATGSPFWGAVSKELSHPAWNGFNLYDIIFPLFLFMSGVATPFSVGREMEKVNSKSRMLIRVVKRGLILVLIGVIYNNGLEIRPLDDIRFGSVLGRIGLAYMFANIIYLYTKERAQMIWFAAILIGYWMLLSFASAPGFPAGDLTMEGNIVSYLDRMIMPGRLYLKIHDPEGLTSTIPAIATGLLGIITGNFLKNGKMPPAKKSLTMVVMGFICIGIAQLWNLVLPINKNLWTSSFAMNVGGYSLILLSLFYYVIDVLGYKKWSFFFRVIGMNSIFIYMSDQLIDWEYATGGTFKWLGQLVGTPYDAVILAICFVLMQWAVLYLMYQKKIFLRV